MLHAVRCDEREQWDELVHGFGGHPLQLWGWGELKEAHGWKAYRLIIKNSEEVIGGAQVLVRHLPFPFKRYIYVPRGPVCDIKHQDDVLDAIVDFVKDQLSGVVLSIEPHSTAVPNSEGWRHSDTTVLISNTVILDLSLSEEKLLRDMTKKTRQYIRKSQRQMIKICRVTNEEQIGDLLTLYRETADRARFPIHEEQYYRDAFHKLGDTSVVYAAVDNDGPVAFLWLAVSAGVAFELYGGMNERGSHLRANYALKWHAIKAVKEWGVAEYDLNGLLNDGVGHFKRGFSSHTNKLIGTYDYPLSALYVIWLKLIPLAKRLVRLGASLRKQQHD